MPADETDLDLGQRFCTDSAQVAGLLLREGVTVIEAEGQAFDPSLHQAVMVEEVEGRV